MELTPNRTLQSYIFIQKNLILLNQYCILPEIMMEVKLSVKKAEMNFVIPVSRPSKAKGLKTLAAFTFIKTDTTTTTFLNSG